MKKSQQKIISILTPVLATAGTVKLLPETIASVARQKLPAGWSYEWIVVEDGKHPKLKNYPWPHIVKYRAIMKPVGEPSARTLALSMARGQYVLAFDADDTLPMGALFKICQAYDKHPEAKWVAGQEATPRHKDPWINRKNPEDRLPLGLCQPQILYPFWLRTGQYGVTFQCSYRTETLWEFGGYPAMPYAGDINLLFAVSTIYPGVILIDILLNYRRWEGQMTAEKRYFAIEDLSYEHIKRWHKELGRRIKNDL